MNQYRDKRNNTNHTKYDHKEHEGARKICPYTNPHVKEQHASHKY